MFARNRTNPADHWPRRRQRTSGRFLLLLAAIAASVVSAGCSGCSQNPYLAAPGGAAWQSQPTTTAADPTQSQLAELRRRVQLLDDNNRQLHTRLAQSEQQSQVYRDELQVVREQLAETTEQFEQARMAASSAEKQVRSFQASTQLRGGATIRANTNLGKLASRLNLGNVPVERDGDVIRVIVSSDQLFQPGTAQLLPEASSTLGPIASELQSVFPQQRIGVEGYTDADHHRGAAGDAHQLTSAQAAAVLGLLTRRAGMPAEQLFVVAHGANSPRESNDSAAGRAANRRVELVVYPETF